MLEDVLKNWGFSEVSAMDVYREVFRFGEGFIQKTDGSSGKYVANPIGYWKNDGDEHGHFRVLFVSKTPLRKRSGSFRRLISL